MSKANTNTSSVRDNKVLIIAVVVIVFVVIFIYFRDWQQQRALELRRLEKRVELLEEWGLRQEQPWNRQ